MKIAMTCDATSEFNTMLGITERTRKCIDESVHDIMNRQLFRVLAIDQACKYTSKVSAQTMHHHAHMSIMTRKKVCGIMIMNALSISSASRGGPSSSGSPGLDVMAWVAGLWSESSNLSSKPLSRISRHFSASGISMRGLCSVALFLRFLDMNGLGERLS